MREQGSTGWGMTVSQRFDSRKNADQAVQELRQAGFRDEDIRVWQHKDLSPAYEDRLERTAEGLLVGGVIIGLIAFFVTACATWTQTQTIQMQTIVGVTVPAAIIGSIVVAVAVNIISMRFSFNPEHAKHGHHEPTSVVTVTVRDRESEARKVFQGARTAAAH